MTAQKNGLDKSKLKTMEKLKEAGFEIAKNYVGNYCTSLEMQGFSLTMLQLDDEIESLLNDPAEIAIRVF